MGYMKPYKEILIRERGYKCECCGLSEWLSQPITLQVHHIDFNNQNHSLDNLQLLCPNCHSFTENFSKNVFKKSISEDEFVDALKNSPTIHQALLKLHLSTGQENYRRARRLIKDYEIKHLYQVEKEKAVNYCIDCGAPIENCSTRCVKCRGLKNRVTVHPSRQELKDMIRTQTFVSIGEKYGVSCNAVKKWCDSYNLPRKKSDIKQISDEDWEVI